MSKGESTRERLLDVAQEIIQTRGYGDMSLDEVAQAVGIRKPSIMHHFPNKAQLGVEVIKRYRAQFTAVLDECLGSREKTAIEALELYFDAYLGFGDGQHKVCLCGALAAEFHALPKELQDDVRLFFEHHQRWLEAILVRGTKTKEFRFQQAASSVARLFLDSLQGALLIARATSRKSHVRDTIRVLRSSVGVSEVVERTSRSKKSVPA